MTSGLDVYGDIWCFGFHLKGQSKFTPPTSSIFMLKWFQDACRGCRATRIAWNEEIQRYGRLIFFLFREGYTDSCYGKYPTSKHYHLVRPPCRRMRLSFSLNPLVLAFSQTTQAVCFSLSFAHHHQNSRSSDRIRYPFLFSTTFSPHFSRR